MIFIIDVTKLNFFGAKMKRIISSIVKNIVQMMSRIFRPLFVLMAWAIRLFGESSHGFVLLELLSTATFIFGFRDGNVSRQNPNIDVTTNRSEITPYT